MHYFYVLLGLGALVLIAAALSLRPLVLRRYRYPYVMLAPVLFTPGQQAFRALMEEALGSGHRILGRTRVADVIGVDRKAGRRARERAEDRLGEQSFDFLICDAETDVILAAVKLLPRSLLRRSGPPRHPLDPVCAAAGLPFVAFREEDPGTAAAIAGRLLPAIQARRHPAGPVRQPRRHPAIFASAASPASAAKTASHADRTGVVSSAGAANRTGAVNAGLAPNAETETETDEIQSVLQQLSRDIQSGREPAAAEPQSAAPKPARATQGRICVEPSLGDPDRIDLEKTS